MAAGLAFKAEILMSWQTLWGGSPCQKHLAKIDAKLPSASFLRATDGLSRAQASVLMQLHTGHMPLRGFLHCIGKAESPRCPVCQGEDKTVHYYLFDCPTHVHALDGVQGVGEPERVIVYNCC